MDEESKVEDTKVEETKNNLSDELEKKMLKSYAYPSIKDPDLQEKLDTKREFYYNVSGEKLRPKSYQDVKEYRDNVCTKIVLRPHQNLLSSFINPRTPYKGILMFHGLGSGKTCAGISIAEGFKSMVQKYNTKIYILVPGPVIKEEWKNALINCTGETYAKYRDKSIILNPAEESKNRKMAINNAMQYNRILSYRSFYKKVLGEKILEKQVNKDNKVGYGMQWRIDLHK